MRYAKCAKPKNNMSEATIQARQRKCISDLRHMIIEHHSCDVMKSEHCLCPVCSQQKNEDVLNEAYSLEKAGDCVPANYKTPDESTLASSNGSATPEEWWAKRASELAQQMKVGGVGELRLLRLPTGKYEFEITPEGWPNTKLCDMAADNPKDKNAKSDSQ